MSGQKIGWRPYSPSGNNAVSTLLTSLYGAWNGDTTGTSLDTSIFGAWNGESNENLNSLETSLFSVYNGESNANDSKGTNNGTVVGSLSYTSGKVGNAFSFNGTNAYVSLPNDSLNFTGDFSVSFWVNPTSGIYTWKSIISNYKAGGSYGYGYAIGINEYYDKLQIFIRNNNQITQQWFDYQFTANIWHHVVISRKASNYTKCYINGTLVSGYYPVGGQNDPTLNPTYISNQITNIGGSNNTAGFNGKLDSVNIWTKELTQTEATQLYNSGMGIEYPFVGKTLVSPNDSVGTNHGTLANGTLITTGKIGNAFTFDGVNDYVSFPTDSWNSTVGTDFSVSLWVKFTSTANQTLVSNMSSPSINYWSGWEIRLVGGQPTIYMWNNSGTAVGAQGALVSTNTWYHIVATRKKGSRTRIYINGVLAQTDTNTPDPSISGTYYPNIGHLQYSSSFHALYMANGSLIDAVNVWTKELSSDEVTQLYNSGTGTQYPFSSQTLPSTANQLGIDNATLMNGCTFGDGKIGKAFTFDGVNDYVQLPNNSLNLTTFSISAWVNPSNTVGSRTILNSANYVSALDYGWKFRIIDGQLSLQIYSTGGLINEYKGGSISTNTWTHVSATRINGSTKLYINGSLVGAQTSGSINNNPNFTTTTYCSIGSLTSAVSPISFFIGSIDSLSVWQKELTQAEITELYNSGNGKQITATPIVQTGLVLNLDASRTSSYPGTGTTWTDISGSGNNGTMVNGPVFGTASGGQITFDGINDRITLQNANIPATGNWTISTWFNLSALNLDLVNGTSGVLYSQYEPIPGNGRFLLLIRNEGTITNKFQLFLGSGTGYSNQTITGTTTAQINTTYNLVAIRNGSVFSLYLNGNLEASVDLTGTNISLLQSTTEIGGVSNGNFGWVNGKIYNTMVYNRALSSTEVTQNFNATKSRFGL